MQTKMLRDVKKARGCATCRSVNALRLNWLNGIDNEMDNVKKMEKRFDQEKRKRKCEGKGKGKGGERVSTQPCLLPQNCSKKEIWSLKAKLGQDKLH